MTKNRILPEAGWANSRKLEKGPNGRNLCRKCKTEVPKGRQTFCSEECVHEWKLRSDPMYVRRQVFQRDHGVCRLCGFDARKFDRIWAGLFSWELSTNPHIQRWKARIMNLYPWAPLNLYNPYHRSLWDADHIVPVIEGGGECGLENYRTLCIPCHQRVTKELHGRLKAKRKELK